MRMDGFEVTGEVLESYHTWNDDRKIINQYHFKLSDFEGLEIESFKIVDGKIEIEYEDNVITATISYNLSYGREEKFYIIKTLKDIINNLKSKKYKISKNFSFSYGSWNYSINYFLTMETPWCFDVKIHSKKFKNDGRNDIYNSTRVVEYINNKQYDLFNSKSVAEYVKKNARLFWQIDDYKNKKNRYEIEQEVKGIIRKLANEEFAKEMASL